MRNAAARMAKPLRNVPPTSAARIRAHGIEFLYMHGPS